MTTYLDFIQILEINQLNDEMHKCIVLTDQEIPDEELAEYLSDKVEDMFICLHKSHQGKTYIALNKTATIKENLENYEVIEGLPSNVPINIPVDITPSEDTE